MLTEKEVKFLNYLLKRLKGEKFSYPKVKEYIKENFKLNDKDSSELAYLYIKNFKPEGFSIDQTDIKRLPKDIPWQVKVMMEHTGDDDPLNFYFDGYKVQHFNRRYTVYTLNDLIEKAKNRYNPCDHLDELFEWGENLEDISTYINISEEKIVSIATIKADEASQMLPDEEIIEKFKLEDQVNKIKDIQKEIKKIVPIIDKIEKYIEKKTNQMEQLVNKLNLSQGDEDLENEISDIEIEIEDLENKLEELNSRYDNIGDTHTVKDLIEEYREEIWYDNYDEVYNELTSNPIEYLMEESDFDSIQEFLEENEFINFNCEGLKRDFFRGNNIREMIDKVFPDHQYHMEKNGQYIILW